MVRPDSGDPLEVDGTTDATQTPQHPSQHPQPLVCEVLPKILAILGDKFGTTTNEQGFKCLNPKVAIIQGDGVSYESIAKILEVIKSQGWSTGNLAFGSGGALLQRLDRDTQKCAFKCSEIEIGEEHRDVYKAPITDPGKSSKKGKLYLQRQDGKLVTVARHAEGRTVWVDGTPTEAAAATIEEDEAANVLLTVFENGKLVTEHTFDAIRERSNQ